MNNIQLKLAQKKSRYMQAFKHVCSTPQLDDANNMKAFIIYFVSNILLSCFRKFDTSTKERLFSIKEQFHNLK